VWVWVLVVWREAAAAAREGPRREARARREGEREAKREEGAAVRAAISTIVAVYESLVERQKARSGVGGMGELFICSAVCMCMEWYRTGDGTKCDAGLGRKVSD
jgi:hypothetical protein